MKISVELPTKHIHELKEELDFNFILAQKILNDSEYRQAYGQGGLMDNGAYEMGTPLDIKQLRIAENMCHPDIIIAPDWLGERERTVRAYKEASALLRSEVAGVVQGDGVLDMLKCYGEYLREGCPFICLPFRLDRVALMELVVKEKLVSKEVWYHFLGLKNAEELTAIVDLDLPYVSIDTSKPIKAAVHGKDMAHDLRGLTIDWDEFYTAEMVKRMREHIRNFKSMANEPPCPF